MVTTRNEASFEATPNEKQSLTMLSGRVHNKVKVQDDTARFSVINADGNFFVKVQGPARIKQCRALKPGDPVVIIGYLGSFIYKNCHSYHTYIQGVVVLAVDTVWSDLWEEAGVPLLFRSLYSELLNQKPALEGLPAPQAV